MKKIAMLSLLMAAGMTVSSSVVIPAAQAAWYYCPVTGCVGHGSAEAVYDHYGRRDGLTAIRRDVLGMLERNSDLGREYNWRARIRRDSGGIPIFGYPGGGYGDDGYYGYGSGRNDGPMSRREKVITGAAVGAAAGYGLGGNVRSAAIGGAAGAGLGLLLGRGGRGKPYFGGGHRDGELELVNGSPVAIDVFDGRKFVGRMRAGESWRVKSPRDGYRAEALVPNSRGGISRGPLEIVPTDHGWIFQELAVARRSR